MTFPEKKFFWIVTASVLICASLPYVFGYISAPYNKCFMGVILNVADYGEYRSWFREFQTANLIRNKLTPEVNEPIFFNLLWWTMGRLNWCTGLGFPILFQVLRAFAGLLFVGAVYAFCVGVLPERKVRRLAFLLIVFAAGFGWILVLLKYTITKGVLLSPLDIYIAEPNSFFCIMAFPHFVLACALIVIVFLLVIVGYRRNQLRYVAVAAMVALILGLQHAYDLAILYGILAMFSVLITVRYRQIPWFLAKCNVMIWLISMWPGLYSLWLTRTKPIWREVLAQYANAGVYTPSPFHLVVLMGLPLLLAALTFDGFFPLNSDSDELVFVKAWFLAGFLLLYVPTDFQVHMLNSWQIPVCILAARGLFSYLVPAILEYSKGVKPHLNSRSVVRAVTCGVVLIGSLTNFYLVLWRFVDLSRHDYPYYLYRDEISALNWLEGNAHAEDIVLSSYTLGHFIPPLSGNTAFLAHWAFTVDFFDKRRRVSSFFDIATPDEERARTLYSFGVDYVFYGPAERSLGNYNPATGPWLTLAFSTPQVSVYRVNADKLGRMFGGSR